MPQPPGQCTRIVGYLITFFPVWSMAILLVWNTGQSAILSCDRLEKNYIQCQQQQIKTYGLRPEPVQSFRLQTARVQEDTDEDSDGEKYQIYTLKLIPYATQPIQFYDYRSDNQQAHRDLNKILKWLGDDSEPDFRFEKRPGFQDALTIIFGLLFAMIWPVPVWLGFILPLIQYMTQKF